MAITEIRNERAGIDWGNDPRPESPERDALETAAFLQLEQECPMIRVELAGTSTGRHHLALLDRWQALDRPRPTFRLLYRPLEEWRPEFEKFLDSFSRSQNASALGESLSPEWEAAQFLATERFLQILLECPDDREELAQTSIGRKACNALDRWKSLGLPHPVFHTLGVSMEEWLPAFEAFLDSFTPQYQCENEEAMPSTDSFSKSGEESPETDVTWLRILQGCPEIRSQWGGKPFGPRLFSMLDRWKELGCPDPVIRTEGIALEELTAKLGAFLDSCEPSKQPES